MTRWLIYALVFMAAGNACEVVSANLQSPALHGLLELLRPGAYAIFGAAAAAGLTNQKALLLLVVAVTVLVTSPSDLQAFARYLVPIGAGILAGTGSRQVLREAGVGPSVPSPALPAIEPPASPPLMRRSERNDEAKH